MVVGKGNGQGTQNSVTPDGLGADYTYAMNGFVHVTSSIPSPTIRTLNQGDKLRLRRLQPDGCNFKLRRSSGGIDKECCILVRDSQGK
jgi:hypothetical protein